MLGEVLALTEQVQVAAVGAAGIVLAASVPAYLAVRAGQRTRQIGERIGDPNGHGSVVKMLTEVLAGQAGQDKRIAKLEAGQHDLSTSQARLEGRVEVLEKAAIRPPST